MAPPGVRPYSTHVRQALTDTAIPERRYLSWRGRAYPIHARILYIATLPLAEVRANLSKLVDEAVRTHERIEVTRQGRRAVVILSADDDDSIMETLAILSDQGLMRELQAAEAEAGAGQLYKLDEVTEEMRAAGRLPSDLSNRIDESCEEGAHRSPTGGRGRRVLGVHSRPTRRESSSGRQTTSPSIGGAVFGVASGILAPSPTCRIAVTCIGAATPGNDHRFSRLRSFAHGRAPSPA